MHENGGDFWRLSELADKLPLWWRKYAYGRYSPKSEQNIAKIHLRCLHWMSVCSIFFLKIWHEYKNLYCQVNQITWIRYMFLGIRNQFDDSNKENALIKDLVNFHPDWFINPGNIFRPLLYTYLEFPWQHLLKYIMHLLRTNVSVQLGISKFTF